jgi:HK97 family phage major capsid protein
MNLDELRQRAAGSPTLDDLRALREALVAELRSLDATAGDNDLSAEQQTRWAELEAEHTAVEARIEAEERAEATRQSRIKYRSIEIGRQISPFDGSDVRSLRGRELRDRALKVLDSREHTLHLSGQLRDGQLTKLEQLIRTQSDNLNGLHIAQRLLLTENAHYRTAFMKMVTRANPVLTPEEARAVQEFDEWRAMSIGTDSAGGFGVPVLIDPTIILTAQGHPNDILGLARVETITTDAWKGVSSAGVTWKFRGEAAAATDGSPTLAQPTVNTHRADGWIPYSIEVGMDYPGWAAEMETLLREGYSELLVQKLTVGAGDLSDEPFGIVTALDANTNVEVATGTAGTITAADINKLWAALPIRYRNPANSDRQAWMSSTAVNNAIQLMGDDNNLSGFTVNLTAEGVVVLKGRRALENDYMAGLATGTSAANLLVVGDWRNYLVAQRAGMSIEFIPHVFDTSSGAPTGQRSWFAWARVGADSINDLGFRLLQNKTS